MANWRVFMSPSRDISNSQEIRQQFSITKDKEKFDNKILGLSSGKKNIKKSVTSNSQQIQDVIYNLQKSSQQQKLTNKKSQSKSNNELSYKPQTQIVTTRQNKILPYHIQLQQKQSLKVFNKSTERIKSQGQYQHSLKKEGSRSLEADKGFLLSSTQNDHDDSNQNFNLLENIQIVEEKEYEKSQLNSSNPIKQTELKNLKNLMIQNNQMIQILSSKLDSFQKEKESIQTLKNQLFLEQRSYKQLDKKVSTFSQQLQKIGQIVKHQQQQINIQQQEIRQQKNRTFELAYERSKSSQLKERLLQLNEIQDFGKNYLQQRVMTEITKPYKKSFRHSKIQRKDDFKNDTNNSYIYKRKYPDLQQVKQTIQKALQEVYFQYMDD